MDFVIPIWVAQKTSSRKYDTIFFLTFFAYFPLFVLWFFNAIEFLINRIFLSQFEWCAQQQFVMSQTRNVWNWIIIIEKASASVDTRNKRVDGVLCVATLFFRSLLLFRVLQTAKIEITTWICISNFVCQIWLNVCVAVFCQWMFLFDRKLFFSLLSTFYCSSAHVFFSGVRRKIEMVPLSKLNCVFVRNEKQ